MIDNFPHILCVNPWIHDFAAFDFWAKPLGLLQLASMIREGGAKVSFLDCLNRFHPKAIEENNQINKVNGIKILKDGRGPFRKKAIPLPEGVQISEKEFSSSKSLSSSKMLSSDKIMFAGKSFSRYGIEPEWFRQDLQNLEITPSLANQTISRNQTASNNRGKPDLILVTSIMTYWASGVKETISIIKEVFPDVPVVLGGIYATLCTEHARKNSMADEVITGAGEEQIYDIIKRYTGFSLKFHSKSAVYFSPTQPLPNGEGYNYSFPLGRDVEGLNNLDLLPYPALDLISNLTYAPILTSRGCPFSCTYCASSFIEPTMRRRSPESVFEEICHWHENYGVHNFAFYDDALLINPEKYILPLLERVLIYSQSKCSSSNIFSYSSKSSLSYLSSLSGQSFLPLSFHTPNALHIRQINKDIADLMFKTGFKTVRLGLETTDFSNSRKEDIKVKKDEFYNAVSMLKQAGFQKDQIGAYLLCGLPNQNLDDVEHSITIVKQTGIIPVLAYYTPIPHTKMWKEAVNHSRFDLENEPFFTNNALFPCINNEHEIKKISELKKMTK
ncbi:MAG: radical SAM protein [Desulfamplus sp.]|nr:radical SAM protein [Desulfamplus sp.]